MNVSPDGAGLVKVDGEVYTSSKNYPDNTNVELEAVANAGYIFSNWDGALSGNDNPVELLMTCDKTVTAYFLAEDATVTIGDFVWEDKDADGIQDNGEPGINGVEVNLYDSDSKFISKKTTSGGGFYNFTDLEPGNYYLEFIYHIGGYLFSPVDQGNNDQIDSDVDINGRTGIISLAYGQTDIKWDAGMYRPNILTYSIPLSPGLQLISLPLVPVETQLDVAISNLDFNIAAMYLKEAESYRLYARGSAPEEGFIWKDGFGYWLDMNSAGTLTFSGSELDNNVTGPVSYPVDTGWNLIGFKSTIPRQPEDYLASIYGQYDIIYGYGDGDYFVVGLESYDLMEPGLGYWIHMLEPGIIYPPLEQIIEDITTWQANEMINAVPADPNLVILDVRTQSEYDEAHIEGAAQLDYYSATFTEDLNNLDKTSTYIVYCRSGGRSADTLDIMENLGFRKAYNILGGITDWIADGFPVTN